MGVVDDSTLGFICFGGFFWLIFAMLGGYVAKEKNRDPAEGACLGLLFGPFGVLVEGLLPTLAKSEQRPTAGTAAPELPKPKPVHMCRVCKSAWESWQRDEMCPTCRLALLNLRNRCAESRRRIRLLNLVGVMRSVTLVSSLGRAGAGVVVFAVIGGISIACFSTNIELVAALGLGSLVGVCVAIILAAFWVLSDGCDSAVDDAKRDMRRIEHSLARFEAERAELVARNKQVSP